MKEFARLKQCDDHDGQPHNEEPIAQAEPDRPEGPLKRREVDHDELKKEGDPHGEKEPPIREGARKGEGLPQRAN